MSGSLPANVVSQNGVGAILDANLNAYVQGDPTAPALRGFIGITGMSVMLAGITAAGDGNGGFFYWVNGSGFTDDNINTIVPNGSSGGAWVRAAILGLAAASLSSPPPIGNVTPNTGAFTSLSASGTVSGNGFINYFASPPPIGSTVPNTGAFTNLTASGTVSGAGFAFITDNIGRNLLHNGLINVAQRGNGPWTTSVYTVDQWALVVTLDSVSITRATLADADRAAIGDESAQFAIQNVFTGNSGATAVDYITQRVEDVYRLSENTVTVSFWAKAASGSPLIGINMIQNFGTGGSPSTSVQVLATGNTVTLSTSWARYTSTITVPSVAGKTTGTGSNDYTGLQLFFSSGANNNVIAGNIGVQSCTIQLWGLQLEIASRVSALEKPDPRYDLSNCQRFFTRLLGLGWIGYSGVAGQQSAGVFTLPVTMRGTPSSVAFDGATLVACSALVNASVTTTTLYNQVTTAGVGQYNLSYNANVSAEL